MIPGHAKETICRPTRQSMRRVRSGTYSRSVTTNATPTEASDAIRIPLTFRCQTATRRTVKTIWVSPRVSE